MVYSVALRLTGNPSDAQDIAQATFMRAYQHFDTLRDNPRAGGWIKTVARNLSLNLLTRYRNRWRFFSEFQNEDEEQTEIAESLGAIELPTSTSEEHERKEMLNQALHKLPDAQRVPLVLFHFEEMSYQEIATHLGISLSKVKIDMMRGHEALRKIIRPEET